MGVRSDDILLEGEWSQHIVCPTHSHYMTFMNVRLMIKTNILQYTRLYIEIVDGKILLGERSRGINS